MTRIGFNDDVLYLGIDHAVIDGQVQCEREARALRVVAPNVVRIASTVDDTIVGTFDLAKDSDLMPFARSLGLPDEQAKAIAAAFKGARTEGRDELAGLAMCWARAERGLGDVPSRLVLSGHCAGNGIYDGIDSSNAIDFDDVRALAKAMPKAAARIEDLMISACNSDADLDGWHDVFPNLKSVWAYGAKSPTSTGAVADILAWERSTRGDHLPWARPGIALWLDTPPTRRSI